MTVRRRRRHLQRWFTGAAILILLLCLRLIPRPEAPLNDPQQSVHVRRVVDGDTLILDGGQRVRLLGIDTPELARDGRPAEPWAAEASEFLRQQVEGRDVSLGFDREPYDKYGRRLAYVYHEGRLINEEIIRQGYSPARTTFPYSSAMKDRFRRAEREAREQERGL